MRSFFIILFSLGFLTNIDAQNDLFLLRKNHRTIRQFYPGISIDFFVENRQMISGQITRIKNDSIYLVQYDIRTLRTGWGSAVFDTITKYHLSFALSEIKGFPNPQRFSSLSMPTIMMIGAVGFAGLNIINAATQNESLTGSTNLTRLGVAAAVFATGYIWKKSKKNYVELGKKYKLVYLKT